MRVHKPEMKKARIEIIPMIDAIFFLLVFFMFSSLSMIKMKGANVNLPTDRQPAAGRGTAHKLILSVTGKGEFYLNKAKISRATVQSSLERELAAHPGALVVLNMSKTQTTQTLIDVLDTINKVATINGVPPSVLIATEPVDASGNPLKPNADVGPPQ
jgi:biopolymer transport protein ExbD